MTNTLKDYSPAASALFNNMRTPAALICGAIVPLGLITAPPINPDLDTTSTRILKRLSVLLAISSLLSEILAIIYSTVAINKVSELNVLQTESVNELMTSNRFELAWVGTNVHFMLGLFGFALVAALKPYFVYGDTAVGKLVGCWTVSSLGVGVSIVNRGIALGYGDADDLSEGHASNFVGLLGRYVYLVGVTAMESPFCLMGIVGLVVSSALWLPMAILGVVSEKKKNR